MRMNIFMTIACIVMAGLLSYWIYDIANGRENDILCGILSSVCLLATLIPMVGLQYENSRIGVNIRVISSVFFLILLIGNLLFAFFGIIMPTYVIVIGLILVVYLAVLYKMKDINFN